MKRKLCSNITHDYRNCDHLPLHQRCPACRAASGDKKPGKGIDWRGAFSGQGAK